MCEYCKEEDNNNIDIYELAGKVTIIKIIKNKLQIVSRGTIHNIKINYCPMCGRNFCINGTYLKAINIKWENSPDTKDFPTEYNIPDYINSDEILDFLTETFNHKPLSYKIVKEYY